MFNNISNPKWFGDWSRLEDEYLDNNFTEIQDNFAFSKRKKTNGLFGAIVSLATAFPVRDPETGHATGAWKVACESIDLDEVPLSDIADMISCFGSKTITDFQLYNRKVDITPWQQALGELLLRGRVQKDDYPWIQCPNSDSALNMMNMVMGANLPKDFFDDCTLGDEEYGCDEEAHEMASARKEIDTPLIAGIKPDGAGNYGGREVETNMVLSVYSRQNFIRYFALLRDMDAFVFVSGKKIEALEDLSGLPLAGNCSGLNIDRILHRPKCLG